MRLIAFVLAAAVAGIVSGPAAAQAMERIRLCQPGVRNRLPGRSEHPRGGEVRGLPGKMVPATIYSLNHNKSLLKVTVIDGRDANLNEDAVIRHHVAKLTQGGQVTFDYPPPHLPDLWPADERRAAQSRARSRRPCCSSPMSASTWSKAQGMRGGEDFDLIKFQQSLTFDRNVRNRTEQQVAAMMAACKGGVAGNDRPGNPAGSGRSALQPRLSS